MSKGLKNGKQHFELTPANSRRIAEYIKLYNADTARVTAKYKLADVVNLAVHRWLQRRLTEPSLPKR